MKSEIVSRSSSRKAKVHGGKYFLGDLHLFTLLNVSVIVNSPIRDRNKRYIYIRLSAIWIFRKYRWIIYELEIFQRALEGVMDSDAFGVGVFNRDRPTRWPLCRKWVAHHQQGWAMTCDHLTNRKDTIKRSISGGIGCMLFIE